MRAICQSLVSAVASLAIALTVIATEVPLAHAQQQPAPLSVPLPAPSGPWSGLQVIVTPYLWLAGINTAISTPLARAPVVDTSVGAFELLGHLNAVPFMGSAELRYGPFGVLGDAMHVPVGTNITTRNVYYSGGKAALTTNIGTGSLLYRVVDQPVQAIDGGLGFRSWGVTADLTLNGALLPTASLNRSGGWTDPLIVGRYHRDFGNGFGLTAYGDVGGFGIAAHADWQIVGTLDYALQPWLALRIGYRSLNVNYQAGGRPLGFNVHMKGPIIVASLRF